MRTQGAKRFVLPVCGILVLLVVGLAMTIRREMRQQERNQALIAAVKATQAQTVQDLLQQGADPDAFERPAQKVSLWSFLSERMQGINGAHTGTPALALAVSGVRSPYEDKAGYVRGVAIVKALLDHGARVDVKNAKGTDMINLAVDFDYDEQILRLLLQHLGNVSHRSGNDQTSLLDRKNPLNGRTPLRSAAAWGSPEAIDLLLRAGAKVDLPDDQGQTALMYAVEKGRPENIASLLKYHANVLLKDKSGNSVLSLARANAVGNVTTSFNHERDEDFWQDIVKMLEQALPSTAIKSTPSNRADVDASPKGDSSNLLEKARRIASTKDWDLPRGMMSIQNYMTYFWSSNDQLLYFADGEQAEELLCQLNVRTGEKAAFHTVSKMWSDDGNFKKWIKVSPDGQWILWDGDHHDHSYHGYYGARRDGSAKFHISGQGFPEMTSFQWMPDSRHFIEDRGSYDGKGFLPRSMVMRRVDAPHTAKVISRNEAAIYSGWYSDWTTHLLPGNRAIRMKTFPADALPPQKYLLEEHALASHPRLLNRWTISIPSTEERREMQLSPDGRRIAWIVVTPAGDQEPKRIAVSVSSQDGSGLQEIGHLLSSTDEGAEPPFERYPIELKWLPDGKHLSFIYHETLYVLPVP